MGAADRHREERRLLRWLRAHGRTSVSREDIRVQALARRLDAEATDLLIGRLAQAGWLRRRLERRDGPGRPAVRWDVNPLLRADP